MIFFKEKYELKAEIDRLGNENDRLSESLNDAQNRNIELLQKISDLEKANSNLTSSGEKIEKERDQLKKMVREQTEADLLVNALKGLGIIPKPEKHDAFKEQERLYSLQREALRMASISSSANAMSPRSGSGLASILGGAL